MSITWIAYAEKHEGLISILAKKKIADFLEMNIKEVFSEETRGKGIEQLASKLASMVIALSKYHRDRKGNFRNIELTFRGD